MTTLSTHCGMCCSGPLACDLTLLGVYNRPICHCRALLHHAGSSTTAPIPVKSFSMSSVTLISRDGVKFSVGRDAAMMCSILCPILLDGMTNMTNMTNVEDAAGGVEDELAKNVTAQRIFDTHIVESRTLETVLEYCTYHTDPARPPTEEWDKQFMFNMDQATLQDVASAATYLGIQAMVKLACMEIANRMKGMTLRTMRVYVGAIVPDDVKGQIEQMTSMNRFS
jgi:hypothetical protein